MVRAVEPVHGKALSESRQHGLHQIAAAERVAGAVEAERRHGYAREMRVAELLRLPSWMQWIRKKEEARGCEAVRGKHRRRATAHRASANDDSLRVDLPNDRL